MEARHWRVSCRDWRVIGRFGHLSTWRLIVAAGLLCGSAAAQAQSPGAGGRLVYEAAYFQQFAPSTALEIVDRVPGFTIAAVDQDIRGFAQAAGNVVINGQRPSSKSD